MAFVLTFSDACARMDAIHIYLYVAIFIDMNDLSDLFAVSCREICK